MYLFLISQRYELTIIQVVHQYGRVGHMKLGREETTYNAQGIWDGHGGCVLLEQHHHYLYAMVSEALDQ